MKNRLPYLFFCCCIFISIFFVISGFHAVDPQNFSWIQAGDPLQEYLGWEFFRRSAWQNPLGLNLHYGLEIGSSIVYTDSIPGAAIFFKLLSPVLPTQFQYLGIWTAICFLLQGIMGLSLAKLICKDKVSQFLIAIFFIFAPIFLFRVSFQTPHSSHFLILAGIYLVLQNHFQKPGAYWTALVAISALINFYLLFITLSLWISSLINRIEQRPKFFQYRLALLEIICVIALGAICLWQAGYFVIPISSAGQYNYGIQRMNLLAPLNAQGWSHILPTIRDNHDNISGLDIYARETESFNYLGLGMLLLLLMSLFAVKTMGKKVWHAIQQFWPLFLCLIVFFLLAISNQIGISHYGFTIPLSHWLLEKLSIVRASGRLFWPVYYCLMIVIFFILTRFLSKNYLRFLLMATLAIQIADTYAGWSRIYHRMSSSPQNTIASTLVHPFWNNASSIYQGVKLLHLDPNMWQFMWDKLGPYAIKSNLSTNSAYLARTNFNSVYKYNDNIINDIVNRDLDQKFFYILRDEEISFALQHFRTDDLLARIDNINVLAPGWLKCSMCAQIEESLYLQNMIPFLEKNEIIQFSKGKNGGKYLIGIGENHSWSYPEAWGTWMQQGHGMISFPIPNSSNFLQLELAAFIFEKHNFQKATISIAPNESIDFVLKQGRGNIVQIPLTNENKRLRHVLVKISSPTGISPKSIGAGNDDRILSIGIESARFH